MSARRFRRRERHADTGHLVTPEVMAFTFTDKGVGVVHECVRPYDCPDCKAPAGVDCQQTRPNGLPCHARIEVALEAMTREFNS